MLVLTRRVGDTIAIDVTFRVSVLTLFCACVQDCGLPARYNQYSRNHRRQTPYLLHGKLGKLDRLGD
jgi:hypothetical protein